MFEYVLSAYLAVDLAILLQGFVSMIRENGNAAQVLAFALMWPWLLARVILGLTRNILWDLAQIARVTLKEMGYLR